MIFENGKFEIEAASMALDAIPVVSNLKSLFELFSGADAVTGEPVSRWMALFSRGQPA